MGNEVSAPIHTLKKNLPDGTEELHHYVNYMAGNESFLDNEGFCGRLDTRTKCDFNGGAETMMLNLMSEFPYPEEGKTKMYQGTGSISRIYYDKGKKGKYYVETCAHNFIQRDPDGHFADRECLSATAYLECTERNNYYAKIPLEEFIIHPKYDGNPMNGYDFAIASIPEEFQNIVNGLEFKNKFSCVENSNYLKYIEEKDTVMVIGFATAEGECNVSCFKSKGVILNNRTPGAETGVILHNAQTSPGQSGSVLYLLPPFNEKIKNEFIQKGDKYGTDKNPSAIVIGIHVACKDDYNVATKKSHEIDKWRDKIVEKFWKGNYMSEMN